MVGIAGVAITAAAIASGPALLRLLFKPPINFLGFGLHGVMRGTSAHAGDPSSDVLIEFRFFCCMYPVRLLWWIHPGCLAFLYDAIIGGKIIV